MQTYRYRFPASGEIMEDRVGKYNEHFTNKMEYGPGCLLAWALEPDKGSVLNRAELETDGNGKVTGINLYMYGGADGFWDEFKDDLMSCTEENVQDMELDYGLEEKQIGITGPVEYMGMDGEPPKTLYHIAERKNLGSILEKGLVPQEGNNAYKSHADYVYLAEKQDITTWLAVLPNLEDPVLLEVDTEGLDVKPGRHFNDRSYREPEGYGEYRTEETIPASRLKDAVFTHGNKAYLIRSAHQQMCAAYKNEDGRAEAERAVGRLQTMGVCDAKNVMVAAEKAYQRQLEDSKQEQPEVKQKPQTQEADDGKPPWDENDNGRNPRILTTENGVEVTIKGLGTYLGNRNRTAQQESFSELSDRELCETVRAHFDSHPTLPGEKALKDLADKTLKSDGDITMHPYDRLAMEEQYAKTRIRETAISRDFDLSKLNLEPVDRIEVSHNEIITEVINIKKTAVELYKEDDGVYVAAKGEDGQDNVIGKLPDRFLTNSPMNVDSCKAELQIVDYSNGKLKNISARVVVDTDLMSGDIVDLDNDMLNGFDKNQGLEQ